METHTEAQLILMAAASESNYRRSEIAAERKANPGYGYRESRSLERMKQKMDGNIASRIIHPPPDKPFKEHTVEEYERYLAERGFGRTF